MLYTVPSINKRLQKNVAYKHVKNFLILNSGSSISLVTVLLIIIVVTHEEKKYKNLLIVKLS